jgi:hypothetical protein
MTESKFNFTIRSDRDVSHDSNVNILSKKYFQLIQNEAKEIKSLDDVIECLKTEFKEYDINKKTLIVNYINLILRVNEFVVNLESNELDIFLLCWSRIYDKRNESRKKELKESIFLNILDCYEKTNVLIYTRYTFLCTMGRVNRILSSFAFLDFNPELGLYISTEILKKEFLGKSSILYDENIDAETYSNILDELIQNEYDEKYKITLNKFKTELLDSLVFPSN